MDARLRLTSAVVVRSRIARLFLAEAPAPASVGSIVLQPHQISAATRLRTALDQFNGALLCDDVGMGKTYVAIAVAQEFTRRLIVVPAALVPMWRDALAVTGTVAEVMTFEALSRADVNALRNKHRGPLDRAPYDLLVVDEAHHARNPATNRHFALSALARGARVLLLTATPVHNKRADLMALLSVFLGSRARTMTSAELALCVVRRAQAQIEGSFRIPTVAPVVHHQLPDDGKLVDELMNLPPPVPVRDGGLGGVLIGRGLVHQWASSEAALHEAVRRRIAKATALCASLEAGTYPSARELETWVYGDGSLQLGFPELLSAASPAASELLGAVRIHLKALLEFRGRFATAPLLDAERARILSSLRQEYPNARIVAFAQYSETVSMLFRRLAASGRLAMLTSHGARVAGGALTRAEAISRFAPRASHVAPPGPAERIDLLLTTDLLSEGVNLQDAEVVVHVDVPWTVARMEQRVGRVARMGSEHSNVRVHLLRPPHTAAAILATEMIVQRKWTVARNAVGTSAPNPMPDLPQPENRSPARSPPGQTERLRSILQTWVTALEPADDDTVVATVRSASSGFIGAISMNGSVQLVVARAGELSTELDAQILACLSAIGEEVPTDPADYESTLRDLGRWGAANSASAAAGVGGSSSVRRRQITGLIDSAIQNAAPHLRSARSGIAEKARRVATAPQCAAVEHELDSLLRSGLATAELLEAIAALESTRAGRGRTLDSSRTLKIHALLLMRHV